MNPLSKNSDCDVAKYFTKLGYTYSWDRSFRNGTIWHEIYDGSKLVFQVDMGIPVEQIVKDLCVIEEIELPYFITSSDQKTYDAFCKRVRDFEESDKKKP